MIPHFAKQHKKKLLGFLILLVFLSETGLWINRSESLEGHVFFVFPWRIKRGDLVAFKRDNIRIIKKVAGIPGDRVSIGEGRVFVKGEIFLLEEGHDPAISGVIEGYFVVGTHPRSFDSRYKAFGLIQEIQGKAWRIL